MTSKVYEIHSDLPFEVYSVEDGEHHIFRLVWLFYEDKVHLSSLEILE